MSNSRRAILALCLLLTSCSRTESWTEDVALRDGRTLPVGGVVTRGMDEWFRPGNGSAHKVEMHFDVNGERVTWTRKRRDFAALHPAVLDFVDQAPVIVLSIIGFDSCAEFDFPVEGLVAFRYESGRWSRVPVAQLPEDLRENVEGQRTWRTQPKQGPTLSELTARNQQSNDACISIRPPPDPERDAMRARVVRAEAQAPMLVATLVVAAAEPEEISREAYAAVHGKWTGAGYLPASCDGVVEDIEQIMNWEDNGSSRHGGYRLLFAGDVKEEIPTGVATPTLQRVVCDEEKVHAVLRINNEFLIVYRFTRQGALVDAVKIQMREAARLAQTSWRTVWKVRSDAGALVISLGEYDNTSSAQKVGTLTARQTYRVRLPQVD